MTQRVEPPHALARPANGGTGAWAVASLFLCLVLIAAPACLGADDGSAPPPPASATIMPSPMEESKTAAAPTPSQIEPSSQKAKAAQQTKENKKKLTQLQTANAALEVEAKRLMSANARLETTLTERANEVARLHTVHATLEAEVKRLTSANARLEATAAEHAQEVARLQQENAALARKVETMTKFQDEQAKLYADLGVVYTQLKAYSQAIEAYEKSLTLEPANAQVHYHLGLLYKYVRNDVEKASQHLHTYLQMSPNATDRKQLEALLGLMQREKSGLP